MLFPYTTVIELKHSIKEFMCWYNYQRRHSGIGKKKPIDLVGDITDKNIFLSVDSCRKTVKKIS